MIAVNIPAEIKEVTAEPLYQWDYGQILRITGDDIPAVCQVHFYNRGSKEAIVRTASQTGDGVEVAIPDALLENEWDIHAFIYVITEGAGNTVKHIQIPINKRKKPADYIEEIPEEVQTEIEQLIANINKTLEEIESLYNETLTVEDLKEMVDERVDEKTAPVIEQINEVVENEDLQDRRITDVEDKAVSNETSIASLSKDMYAILNGYPARINASPTSLDFYQADLGTTKSVTITTKAVGDPTFTLKYELVEGDAGDLQASLNGNTFSVYYASAQAQGVNTYKIYANGNPSIYVTVKAQVH